MGKCVFCEIAAANPPGVTKDDVFYSTEDVLGFMDIQPLVSSKAHVLVIPRRHFARVTDTPPDIMSAVGAALPKIANALCESTQSTDFNIVQNNGPSAGQVVYHVHFHVIARNAKDIESQKTSKAAEKVRGMFTLKDRNVAQMHAFGRGQRTDYEPSILVDRLRTKL